MKGKCFTCITGIMVVSLGVLFSPDFGYTQEGDHGYVSSKGCGMCHKPMKGVWDNHSHARMLRPVEGGAAPEGADVTLPEGMTWADLSYLIGGDKHYARFVNSKGYVVTGEKAQWSLDGKAMTAFQPEVPNGTLKYECIKCHVVGWSATETYEKGMKNELEGVPGKWYENSVGCEACHGPGHEHAALGPKVMQEMKKKDKKADLKIVVTKKSDLCGECHKRNADDKINVSAADLIESRQQYSEMKFNKKGKMNYPRCVDCHNPHATSHTDDGFVKQCEDCHKGDHAKPVKIAAMKDLTCRQCHMPLAVRGAYDSMEKGYHKGDAHSHIFGITLDPDYKLDDGSGHATINGDGFARLTVEMTCYACHQSGYAETKTREVLLEMGKQIH